MQLCIAEIAYNAISALHLLDGVNGMSLSMNAVTMHSRI